MEQSRSLELATKLAVADKGFTFEVRSGLRSLPTASVYTEGKSDRLHLEAALRALQRNGMSQNLSLDLGIATSISGEQNLLKHLKEQAQIRQTSPQISVFDRDNEKVLGKVTANGGPEKWAPNVFSLALPIPPHRSGRICTEHYYTDADLKRVDSKGRRLFTADEFDASGHHLTEALLRVPAQGSALIVDNNVYPVAGQANVAKTKMSFAQAVMDEEPPFDEVDFRAFRLLCDQILERILTETPEDNWRAEFLQAARVGSTA